MKSILAILITALLFLSFSETKQDTIDSVASGISKITYSEIIALETANEGIVDKQAVKASLGYDYYPNTNNYDLPTVVTINKPIGEYMERSGEYFFSPDSVLRAVLFTYRGKNMLEILMNGGYSEEEKAEKNSETKSIFSELEAKFKTLVGPNYKSTIKQDDEGKRIEHKRIWKESNKLKVYLASSGSQSAEYFRLRLMIYKD